MKEIDFEDFYNLCQNGCSTIIDVREVEEFEALHLEGALNSSSESTGRYL